MEQRRIDYHLHTLHSFDGRQTVDELCKAMVAQNVQEICLTEHIEYGHPDPACDVPPIWDVWLNEINQARMIYPDLTIRAGVEIGDNPTCRVQMMADLKKLHLDFHLLSLHLVDGVDPYEARYFEGKTRNQAYRDYAEAKAASIMAWDDFDSVAHIGYVSKFSPYQGEEKALKYQDAPDAFDAMLKHIISHDACLEINTSGYEKTGDTLPHTSIIKRYIELGGTCFTFGSDSHDVARDYAEVERAKEQVRTLGGKYQASYAQRKKICWKI